jgi:hypothetical protein
LIGSRLLRRRRLRNLLLAHLVRERGEAEDEEDEGEEGSDEEGPDKGRKLVRLLVGSRLLRRRRVRRALLAHLLSERGEAEEDGEDEHEDEFAARGDGDHRLIRLLIGSRILQRRRARRMLVAHLLRERSGSEEDDEGEGEEEFDSEGDEGEHRLMRLLIGSRVLHRRRARRMLLAHLLRERSEAAEDESEGEGEDEFGDGGDREHQLLRLLAGHRIRQRKRARRLLMAHLLREHEEA